MPAVTPSETSQSPSGYIVAVTPSDTVNFTPLGPCRGLSIGVAGTLSILTAQDQTITYASGELVSGVVHPLQAKRVNATGTAATAIKAYW